MARRILTREWNNKFCDFIPDFVLRNKWFALVRWKLVNEKKVNGVKGGKER